MSVQEIIKCDPCREFEHYLNRIESNGIYVSDLPAGVTDEEVHRFFSGWGQIADLFLADNGQYCLVHFQDREPVDQLVSYPVALFGKVISIRPRFKDFDRVSQNIVSPLHKNVLKSITGSVECTFQEQVKAFLIEVGADESIFLKQEEVIKDLKTALKSLPKDYDIMPFGSSLNGLAFKDSDLDIFFGRESKANGMEVKDIFRRVRAALEKNNLFTKLKPIPNARVPIIKFVHKTTGLNCDLSFRNTMGIQNSKLIKFLISLDSRVKPFFMIVKFWAKIHRITGKRMSNYSLILLLISFLQSLHDPILPRLLDLQHKDLAPAKVGVWNAAFDDDVTRLRPISNDLPLEELLSRFFESVGKTDFSNYAVCPLLGSLIHKEAFYQTSRLPPEIKESYTNLANAKMVPHLKVESILCVQDPIEQNHNVTKNVAKHDFQHFVEHCFIAAGLSNSLPPHLFLPHLLSSTCVYPRKESQRAWHPNPMYTRPLRPYLTLNIPIPENISDEISWRDQVAEKLVLIFRKVLKISVDKDSKGDSKPGSDQTFVCKGSQVLWKERDRLWKKWFSNKSTNVEILDISADDEATPEVMLGEKRKRSEEEEGEEVEGTSKKRKLQLGHDAKEGSSRSDDIIVIDIDVDTKSADRPRSIQEEIDLTNKMVKECHALPASTFILNFKCNTSKVNEGVCIELNDRRSRNSYFSSLCMFLEDFICRHLTPEEATFT